jgi:hypothetical protein
MVICEMIELFRGRHMLNVRNVGARLHVPVPHNPLIFHVKKPTVVSIKEGGRGGEREDGK